VRPLFLNGWSARSDPELSSCLESQPTENLAVAANTGVVDHEEGYSISTTYAEVYHWSTKYLNFRYRVGSSRRLKGKLSGSDEHLEFHTPRCIIA